MASKERVYYDLTHPQKRIWYIDQVNSGSPLHNIGGCLDIRGVIDLEIMKNTLNIIIKSHEGLRLRFAENKGQPMQYVDEFAKQNIDFFDFSKYAAPEADFEKWLGNVYTRRFDLYNDQLVYFAIYKVSEKRSGVVCSIHHIISDGWSAGLIEKQICEIYGKLICGQDICLEQSCSYLEFIKEEEEYLNSGKFGKNKTFWQEKLKDLPREFLDNSSLSVEGKRQSINISAGLSKQIREFVTLKRCSLNTFFMAILIIYIHKITNKNDLVIGTPVFNRTNKKQRGMIGMFTSTMPFRIIFDPQINISSLLDQINKEIKLCLFNQRYPYDLLVKDLELSKLGYDSLFKMYVNYYNADFIDSIAGYEAKVLECYSGNQSYSLQLTVKEWEESNITLNFDYKLQEYTESEIKAMQEAILHIAGQVSANQELTIEQIKLLSQKEIDYKLYELNDTFSEYPREKTVRQLFEEQVKKSPERIALEFEGITLTYRELNEKANRLAHYLQEKNIGRYTVVAIMASHSPELIISILGVLKAGGAYLPIDPSYPEKRINYLLKDSRSSLLLTNRVEIGGIEFAGEIIDLDNIDLSSDDMENITNYNTMNDLVYLIYTSGSTGVPKGAMIKHQGLTNYIWWAAKTYFKSAEEAMALYSSISFDLTVTSIFAPLICGQRIVIYHNDDKEFILYRILRENKVTVIKLTPAHLTLLKDSDNRNSNIKRFIVGGDDLKVSLAQEISDSFGKPEIYNEYGPTETVVGCMIYQYNEKKDKGLSVPIGCPINNVQIYILDSKMDPVPTGSPGEIYISGDGVAPGYLNNEELTRKSFLDNPFLPGERMYKTGDLARYSDNGVIEYLGRADNQVKIRGHRVELGEIEKCLAGIEAVNDAVVTYSQKDGVLNGYIVTEVEISDKELRGRLLQYLPQYMVPAGFIFLAELPLTINGKVDHALLPKPVISKKEFIQAKTPGEKELVKAMQEILMIEEVSLNDNYYRLGGDSIKAIQIAAKLNNAGFALKVKDILTYELIGEIAVHIEAANGSGNIEQGVVSGELGKTPIIKWFFAQDFADPDHYNQSVLLKSKAIFAVNDVRKALLKLIKHHDSLRLNYHKKEDILLFNNERLNELPIVDEHDLSADPYDKQVEKIQELGLRLKSSFDLEKGILFKAALFKLGEGGQIILLIAHHLVIDGVSWRIIIEDFTSILRQLGADQEVLLPLKTHSFQKWSEQLDEYSKGNLRQARKYWESVLGRNFYFPFDFNLGMDTMDKAFTLQAGIDREMTKKILTEVNNIYGLELHETLIIALAMVIRDITGLDDIVIELEGHGRTEAIDNIDVSRTVGWFTSLYPAQFKLSGDDLDFNIKGLKEQIRNIPGKGFDFGILKYLRNEFADRNNRYLRFNYLGDFDNLFRGNMFELIDMDSGRDSGVNNHLTATLDINAMVLNGKLIIDITYSKNKFQEKTVKNFLDMYVGRLEDIIELSCNQADKKFTPSDFSALDISQEDLDRLFL